MYWDPKNLEVFNIHVGLRHLLSRAVNPPQPLSLLQMLLGACEEPEATRAHSLYRALTLTQRGLLSLYLCHMVGFRPI